MSLYRKMKTTYEDAQYPDAPANVNMEVNSPTSFVIYFEEPSKKYDDCLIVKYLGKARSK
jgi:hypothetical protein